MEPVTTDQLKNSEFSVKSTLKKARDLTNRVFRNKIQVTNKFQLL